jgi:transcription elongation factor Elf1
MQVPQAMLQLRLDQLQTEVSNMQGQIDTAVSQISLLTDHIGKMSNDSGLTDWAKDAKQVFERKGLDLMGILKTGAMNLTNQMWTAAQRWALDSPKMDMAIDSLLDRGGITNPVGSHIQLGDFVFACSSDGDRTISDAATKNLLYSQGLLSSNCDTKTVVKICEIPAKAEKYCQVYDKKQEQAQTKEQSQEQSPKMAMRR